MGFNHLLHKVKAGYFSVAGLIIFFTLHRWNDLYEFLSFWLVLKITFSLLFTSAVYFILGYLFFRDKSKAGFFVLISFFVFLFFDFVKDTSFLIERSGVHINSKIILLAILIGSFFFIFLFKRMRFTGFIYFNSLFLLLIIFECTLLISKNLSLK